MTQEQTNKALARACFEEIWNQGDATAIDRYVAESVKGSDAAFGLGGREAFKKSLREWRNAFPDLHYQIIDQLAEGDKVLSRWILTGTHKGEFMGAEPTGKKVRVEGMSLDRVEDGLVVEGFDGWDNYGLRQQIGLVP